MGMVAMCKAGFGLHGRPARQIVGLKRNGPLVINRSISWAEYGYKFHKL